MSTRHRYLEQLLIEIINTNQAIHDNAIEASTQDEQLAEERALEAYGRALELGHDPCGLVEAVTVDATGAERVKAVRGIAVAEEHLREAEERSEAAWALAYEWSKVINTAKNTLVQLKAA